MIHFTNRSFAFAEGECLYIPDDFSGINGWHVSQTGVTEVCFLYVYLIIGVMHIYVRMHELTVYAV